MSSDTSKSESETSIPGRERQRLERIAIAGLRRQPKEKLVNSFGFKNLEHALATAARDVVVGARAVSAISAKISKAEPVIEQVTALIDPPAVVVERAAFAALGIVAKAANDTSTAASAQGLNIQLDQKTLEDFRQVYATLVDQLHGDKQAAPPSVAAPAAHGS